MLLLNDEPEKRFIGSVEFVVFLITCIEDCIAFRVFFKNGFMD